MDTRLDLKDLRIESIALVVLALFFTFEHALVAVAPFLGVVDDAFAAYAILYVILKVKALPHRDRRSLILCLGILVIGLAGNVMYRLMTSVPAIAVDAISIYKVFAAFFFVRAVKPDDVVISQALSLGASLARIIVFLCAITLLVSQFADIGMSGQTRYGMRSFAFIFDHNPGNFSKAFYLIVPLLIIDLNKRRSLYYKVMLMVALVVWCSTLRSRALAFAACTLLLLIWFFAIKPSGGSRRKIRPVHIMVVGLIAVLVCWDQIIFYFTNDTQARSNLLRYSIVTAESFFPLGAGFGTYGSNVAAEYYSPLYIQYGFQSIYGMTSADPAFLNDNYWPMIIGQFGIVGFVLVVGLLIDIFVKTWNPCKDNPYYQLAALLLIGYLLLSSTASKSYSEFSSVGVFIYMGLLSCASTAVVAKPNKRLSGSLRRRRAK